MLTRGHDGFAVNIRAPTRWAFASTADATTPILFNGSATVTVQESGSQMAFIGRNDHMDCFTGLEKWHPFDLVKDDFEFEGILLEPGDVL